MARIIRITFVSIRILIVLGTAVFFIWIFPPPTICPASETTLETGSWSEAQQLPTARSELAAAALNGRIYVAGGLRTTGATNTFEVYNVARDTWQEAADLPRRLHHMGLTAIGSRLFLTGGYEGNNLSDPTDEAWVYEPELDSWSVIATMPGSRAAHATAALDDKLYIVGGMGVGSNFLWVYDPDSDSWETTRTSLPTLREHLAAVALKGKLYAIGGRMPDQGNLTTVEIFDPARGTWERAADMPTARGGITAAVLDGNIHIAGGEDFNASPNCTFANHERFDAAKNQWTTLPSLPTPRHGLSSSVVDGRWFVIGGGEKAATLTLVSTSDQVDVYDP